MYRKGNLLKEILLVLMIISLLVSIVGCGTTTTTEEPVKTDTYPSKPIEVVIPQAAGGGFDLTARALASVAHDYLGVPMTITLKPGGGTVVGTSSVATARPDGYTLLLCGEHALTLGRFEDIPVNFLEDLVPIARFSRQVWFLAVPGDKSPKPSPFYTLQDLIDYAKEHPGELNVSNSGAMTHAQLIQLLLETQAGIEFNHIPYDGGGPNRLALQSGESDASAVPSTWGVPDVEEGFFRPLAVAAEERMPEMPDVPTFKELGFDIIVNGTYGIFAPKDTPEEVLNYLEAKFKEISEDPSFVKLMNNIGEKVEFLGREDYKRVLQDLSNAAAKAAENIKKGV